MENSINKILNIKMRSTKICKSQLYHKHLILLFRKNLLRISYCLCILASLFLAMPQKAQADNNDAERFVQNTAEKVISTIQKESSDTNKMQELNNIFLETVNIQWMAKFALARNIRLMSTEQKNEYIQAYKEFLLKSYVPKFRKYNGQDVKIVSSKQLSRTQFIVTTEIIDQNTSNRINVSYRCRMFSDGKIRVIDIIAENVSLMASQRSEFGSIVSNEGIDSLINKLRSKTN
jgi:phospholipid transport system substrate-binding protein